MPNSNMEEKDILNTQELEAENGNNNLETATQTTSDEPVATPDATSSVEMDNENEVVETDTLQPQPTVIEGQENVGEIESVQASEQTVTGSSQDTNPETMPLDGIEEAKWYVLHTFSGYENVAKENLEIVVEKYSLQNRIFDIVIPTEDVIEEKNGKRKVVTRKLMPGYILVKMRYGDDIWHAVAARTRGITGFVGPKGRPLNLTEEEIRKMHLEKVTVIDVNLAVNDKVEVLEGPLNGFAGTVVSVDVANSKCRVVVEMFGRETPVDLSLAQVRKLD